MRIIVLVATLFLASLPFSALGQEPAWGKFTLSGWKRQLQEPSDDARHAAAMEFMFMDLAMVKQAIPELREARKDQNDDVRFCAERSLSRCGGYAATSVPKLIALLEGKPVDAKATGVREEAVEALGNIGEILAVPVLIRQLGVNPQLDDATALALCRLGAAAKPALPALKRLIREDAQPEVLAHAGMAIAGLEPEAPEVKQAIILMTPLKRPVKWSDGPPFLNTEFLVRFPELTVQHVVPLLDDKDKMVRRGAARVLAAAGPKAKEQATAPLKKTLQDSEFEVRVAAVRELHAVAPDEFGPAVPVLVKLLGPALDSYEAAMMLRPRPEDSFSLLIRELDNKAIDEQESLIETLYYLRQDSVNSKPRLDAETIAKRDMLLIAALGGSSLRIRRGSASVVARLGPQASAAVPALLQLTKDADGEARLDAIAALVAVDPEHHSWLNWLPSLEVIVREKSRYTQVRALLQIRQLGPAAKSAVPTLLKVVEENEGSVRALAAIMLVYADPSQKAQVLPALLEEIKNEGSSWRDDTAEALGAFGPSAREALPALQAALASQERFPEQKVKIIKALTSVDPGQISHCRPVVEKILKSHRYGWRPRLDILKQLPEWGAEAKPLAPVLRELATNGKVNAEVEIAAAVSLVLIGGDDDDTGLNIIRQAINTPAGGHKREQLLRIADQLGPLARPLAPELRPLTTDANLGAYAMVVLAKIDPKKE